MDAAGFGVRPFVSYEAVAGHMRYYFSKLNQPRRLSGSKQGMASPSRL